MLILLILTWGIVSQLKSLASLGTKTHQKKRQELKKKIYKNQTLYKERIKFKIVLRSKKEVQPGVICLHPPNVIFRERIRLKTNRSPTVS